LHNESSVPLIEGLYKESAIPFIALSEVFYTIYRRKGEEEALRIYRQVLGWELPILFPKESTLYFAGLLKVKYHREKRLRRSSYA